MDFMEGYPTKSSNYLSRSTPNSKITFAAGTRFTNRIDRRLTDMIKNSTYNIKPIKREKEFLTRYRAPAATIPVGPYQSVTKRDYIYPSEQLLRAMNPQPKWIYRSKSDLGLGRILDHDYQYFNNGRTSSISTEDNEKRNESVMVSSHDEAEVNNFDERLEHEFINTDKFSARESEVPTQSKQFEDKQEENNYYAFYKPLVGDSRDRYIESAYMKRAVEGVIIPFQIENKDSVLEKRSFVPRRKRFTDTLNKVLVPRPDSIAKFPTRFPQLNRYNTSLNLTSGKPERVQASDLVQENPTRAVLYQRAPEVHTIDKDMVRTYEKQAKLREMIQK